MGLRDKFNWFWFVLIFGIITSLFGFLMRNQNNDIFLIGIIVLALGIFSVWQTEEEG